ncbi:DUF84 family protein [Metabacillus herbersteinensis]|uniref:Probable inosine/xanthosine triphosphatase n=1 Tax=Metabacillus herbersteinensis TaxID=283816 RepID=A0ABV6GBN9_9BACI
MKIAIGTTNPTKVNAVKEAFASLISAEFQAVSVASGVAEQPLSDEETISGAINRANAARLECDVTIGIGLEGGVVKTKMGYFLCNWGAIIDGNNEPIVAGGSRILLPTELGEQVFNGKELGDVMDEYTNQHNVRQNEGAIGIFTSGYVNRTEMFTHLSKLLLGQYLFSTQSGNEN